MTLDETQSFSIVPRFVWQGCRPREVRVYAALAAYVDWDTGVCWPSRATLAHELGCSVDTVDRALAVLEKAGAIEVDRRRKSAGHHDTNLYRLPFAINRRAKAVENPEGGGRKTAATWPQNRGPGGRKTAAQNENQELDKGQSPKNDPESCPHHPIDDDGYCTACGTEVAA